MLSQQLRELEVDGLVYRKNYGEVPPRVEYSLSKLSESLLPILRSLYDWGSYNHVVEHIQRIDNEVRNAGVANPVMHE